MTISILGAGWLGLPLAQKLLQNNYVVKGSTTKMEKLATLRAVGIQPFMLNLTPEPMGIGWDFFLEADVLVINIPPRLERQEQGFCVAQMVALTQLMQRTMPKKIIYVSSTSVYPELNRQVFEADVQTPPQAAASALVEAENMIQTLPVPTVILRCGGLMGYDRVPGKYVAGKQQLTTGDIAVNYIHRDDAVGIIVQLIEADVSIWNQTYNAVAPVHPTRRDVYNKSCVDFLLELPTYAEPSQPLPFKIVNSDKITAALPYQFIYPDPLEFLYTGYEQSMPL